jgi:hypothetical protein
MRYIETSIKGSISMSLNTESQQLSQLDTQWSRLDQLHCHSWLGRRTWYDREGFILDSVVARRILEVKDENTVSQINLFYDGNVCVHQEQWELLRSDDNNTYFPPIPSMQSYFAKDGSALWAAPVTSGKAFKFELFLMHGNRRISVMVMYDEEGKFDRLWHVQEEIDTEGSLAIAPWCEPVGYKFIQTPIELPLSPPTVCALSNGSGNDCQLDSSYQKSLPAGATIALMGNLRVEIPRDLNLEHLEAFIEWLPGGNSSEPIIRGVAWKTPDKRPIFLIFA